MVWKIRSKKLLVGKASYELLIWPANMINVRRQTVPLLARFLEDGGEILALSPPAGFVDGRASEQVKELASRYAKQWNFVSDRPTLLTQIHQRLKPRVVLDPSPPNVGLCERTLPGGDRLLFFANTGFAPVKTKVTVKGGSLERWDAVTGKIETAFFQSSGNGSLHFDLDLPAAGSKMFVVKQDPTSSAPQDRTKKVHAPNDKFLADRSGLTKRFSFGLL